MLQQKQHHPLQMAGFGGSGGGTKKNKKKAGGSSGVSGGSSSAPIKLKVQTQWDRYCDTLKGATIYPVAVRVVGSGDERGDWVEVGGVKSEGDSMTEIAVAMQRGLIVEHAKRLLTGQVKPNDVVEWGYGTPVSGDDEQTFTLVDKSVMDDAPKGVESKIGFQGTPDPNSGFYFSKAGRVSDKSDAARQRGNGSVLDMSVLPRRK